VVKFHGQSSPGRGCKASLLSVPSGPKVPATIRPKSLPAAARPALL
jgi:hypothetical protein